MTTYEMRPPWGAPQRAWFADAVRSLHESLQQEDTPEGAREHGRGRRHEHHGRGRGRRGPGGFGPGGFGPGFGPGFGGPGFGFGFGDIGPGGRGPRVRRGDVRAAVLSVLADEAMNGYQVIQQIAERSGGAWRPSPGSVYPTLSQLEDEGLVAAEDGPGKTFTLTAAGRAYAEEHADELAAPWAAFDGEPSATGHEGLRELRDTAGALAAAVFQVARTGSVEQRAAVTAELDAARRRVYRILAGDDPVADADA